MEEVAKRLNVVVAQWLRTKRWLPQLGCNATTYVIDLLLLLLMLGKLGTPVVSAPPLAVLYTSKCTSESTFSSSAHCSPESDALQA